MARAAFTLVEMLVAVGLVVLLMTLFATIFQIATGAMSTQKGLAENDQHVRLVLTRLRNDLNGNKSDPNDPNRPYRTFRNLVPYGPDEIGTPGGTTDRGGYFYISENDPNDDTDDVLAFTVFMPTGSSERFTGRAAVVFPQTGTGSYGLGNPKPAGPNPYPPAAPTPPAPDTLQVANLPGNGQQYWPNQPEFDDIQGTPNLAGNSPYAEVCYFLRRGTLYRRVMLIRQPNVTPPPIDGTPTNNLGASLNLSTYSNGTRNFWTDFDYAAYFDGRVGNVLRFHGTGAGLGTDSLSNSAGLPNPFVLGNPAYRFGFDCTTVGGNPSTTFGQPREYVTSGGNPYFIGRFTQAETSDSTFGYPGNLSGASGNPMNSLTTLNYNATTGVVSNYAGPRGGEDVLMTNVLKFDIKVFDPAASVGPDGHAGIAGFVHPVSGILDDDDGDGIADNPAELGWPGSDDGDFRDIGHNGTTGFYNNPNNLLNVPVTQHVPLTMKYKQARFTTKPILGPLDYFYPNTNYSNPLFNKNRYDTWNPKISLTPADAALGIIECPPFRPFNYGPDGKPGYAGIDDDGDGTPDNPGELGWAGTDDQPVPLGAIQIKITFYDRTSKQVREATLVQSLLYTP